MSDHRGIFTQFFLDLQVIFSSNTMFINASTKEFTLINNAFLSHDVAFDHLLYFNMVVNVYLEYDNIFKSMTYSILIFNRFLSR